MTLQQDKLLAGFFDLMKNKGWIYRLSKDAHRLPGHLSGAEMAGA